MGQTRSTPDYRGFSGGGGGRRGLRIPIRHAAALTFGHPAIITKRWAASTWHSGCRSLTGHPLHSGSSDPNDRGLGNGAYANLLWLCHGQYWRTV